MHEDTQPANHNQQSTRRPDWLKVRLPAGANYTEVRHLLKRMSLHTVCEEAHCPNIGECFEQRTATFLILGDVCTRNCHFCAVTPGRPTLTDPEEPGRVANAVSELGLRHVVITSVTRDDLPDGGAAIFAATVEEIRLRAPACSIELLIPDLQGSEAALRTVLESAPDILNHNVETVPRLYRAARPQAIYERSLAVLRRAKELRPTTLTKSGLMVGLGEQWDELLETMVDLRAAQCDILTLGQYLSPSRDHLPIQRYYTPEEFSQLREKGEQLGFLLVESGPLVRSSYHAARAGERVRDREGGKR
ncbi:MAG: lipoyl synthase [Chloroflexota bacterium]|nr:MAG: lipoyl synthase [Chloroflexota bacterium]